MPRPLPRYPAALKHQLVELVKAGESPESLARRYPPSAQTIRNWVNRAEADRGHSTVLLSSGERAEFVRLRRDFDRLREENEALKKIQAWLASGGEAHSGTPIGS